MKIIIISASILLIVGLSTAFSAERIIKETIRHQISKSAGTFTFVITKTRDNDEETSVQSEAAMETITRIDIFKLKKKIQTIDFGSGCIDCTVSQFADLNFDGFDDLFIQTATGSGGSWHEVWLFNPRHGAFEKLEDPASLQNYVLKRERKEVMEIIANGASSGGRRYYKVIDGKLVLYKRESIYETEDGKAITEIEVKSNGNWKQIKKTTK